MGIGSKKTKGWKKSLPWNINEPMYPISLLNFCPPSEIRVDFPPYSSRSNQNWPQFFFFRIPVPDRTTRKNLRDARWLRGMATFCFFFFLSLRMNSEMFWTRLVCQSDSDSIIQPESKRFPFVFRFILCLVWKKKPRLPTTTTSIIFLYSRRSVDRAMDRIG